MEESGHIKLSVIIVNYNVKYFLEQALQSVRKAAAGLAVEVLVVDNNSVDDSVAMVREKFPEVRLIANDFNPGFSIANNMAIERSQGTYVLLLNPDTVVEEDTFRKILDFMDEHPEAGGLGVKMIDGTGAFLPESKRGFPSPFVAFAKAFGLSRLFPRSRLFNHYHLGYLDKEETHEVEVLSGAFMLLRRSVLDEIGLLDESFFMYGEDIDISYRIIQAGYKNYYFAGTTIIHYKGESTKKGSLNYVRTFYNAMIIFARKHFQGDKARLFILMIQMAIYFRAALTVIMNIARRASWPLMDAVVIGGGLFFIKDLWAAYFYKDPHYYPETFVLVNLPLYLLIWLAGIYFSGGYDAPDNLRRLVRGLLVGTLFLAAVYGFLPLEYRFSRALIVLGALWALVATIGLRLILHFLKYRNFQLGKTRKRNLVIAGSAAESQRVQDLLHRVQVQQNFIGTVAPAGSADAERFLSDLSQLEEIVHIYKVDEIIFCSEDIPTQEIMHWMSTLGPELEYKIVPSESLSIIGSSSKNRSGELYTVDIEFSITTRMSRRNKRVLDMLASVSFLLCLPVLIWAVESKWGMIRNIFAVLAGWKSWVGYLPMAGSQTDLPSIRPGVLSPLDGLEVEAVDIHTARRLNFFYAKDYQSSEDLDIIWKGIPRLGRR